MVLFHRVNVLSSASQTIFLRGKAKLSSLAGKSICNLGPTLTQGAASIRDIASLALGWGIWSVLSSEQKDGLCGLAHLRRLDPT